MQVFNIYRCNQKVNLKRGVASKVTYIFGNEYEALCVEGTPDFYARTTHPFHPKIVYLLIGEGSDFPETQLVITTLGHLIHPTRNVIAATLFMKSPYPQQYTWELLNALMERFLSSSEMSTAIVDTT